MYKRLFTFLLIIVSLTSCTMTEEVTVNEKGEVEYLQKIDMPQFAAMMNSSDLDEKIEKNLISNTEYVLRFYEDDRRSRRPKNKG